jgi:penicillin-binding protein 2
MNKFRPGITFSDFVIQDHATKRSKIPRNSPSPFNIGLWIGIGVFTSLILLFVRLGSLQIIQGSRFRVLADENRVRTVKLTAPRGVIVDRHGQALAQNIKTGEDEWKREYPLGAAASHILGYLGEVSEDEVGLLKSSGGKYDLKDSIGRSGIEFEYESLLRGINGGRFVEVDNMGSNSRELGRQNPSAGADLKLTLDGQLQKTAFDALGGKKGAVVASNPKTGEILVMTSSPSFDPNDLTTQYSILSTRTDLPFLNRAIGGIYPPGSTYKMVSAIAAMQEGKVPESFTFEDTGAIHIGSFSYTNWYYTGYGGTEGVVGWSRALARSTDTFFYKIGEMTGPELMAKWSTMMGLGVKSGIDLPGEIEGLIPTPLWKERVKKEKWFVGNSFHMAIGQGDILVTPLQVNVMTGILASGGKKCKPHFKAQTSNLKSQNCEEVQIDEDILKIIHEGMLGACAAGGTAFPFFDFEPKVACKTGTAEYVKPDGKIGTHAWFTAYAPADDPTIAITSLLEAGGEGSRDAAPIVRKVLSKYFGVVDNFNYNALSGQGE